MYKADTYGAPNRQKRKKIFSSEKKIKETKQKIKETKQKIKNNVLPKKNKEGGCKKARTSICTSAKIYFGPFKDLGCQQRLPQAYITAKYFQFDTAACRLRLALCAAAARSSTKGTVVD